MNPDLTKDDLRSVRRQLGLTQGDMAQKLGVTREWVGMLERGDRDLSASIILELNRLIREHELSIKEDSSSLEVREHQASYGTPEMIRREIEQHQKELVQAAGDDSRRLGWIHEQQRAHLAIPAHWKQNSPAPEEESEAEYRERVARIKASLPDLVVPGINDDQTPPKAGGQAG